jgi:TnpA family transposase
MIEGVVRHGADVQVENQYVDTHGQNEAAFGICRMLGFNLRPRLKGIHLKKLYKPDKAMRFKHIGPVVRGAIDWALIERNYDQMVKHIAALRIGTASSEAIMSRFTRKNHESEVY